MRALVTGAAGFLGRHVARQLRARGFFVRGSVRRDADGLPVDEAVPVGDISAATDWRDALATIDTVYHLAALAHVRHADAAACRITNVEATVQLARSAASAGVRRFVFVSTARVMGDASYDRPFTENDEPRPADAYSESKWIAEQQLATLSRDMEIVVVRPPLVYGPGVRANFLALLRAASSGWPLPLGGADAPRSLLYAGNLADALVLCGTHTAAAGRTFFVTDGHDISVAALLARLRTLDGRAPRLWTIPCGIAALMLAAAGRRNDYTRLFRPLRFDAGAIRSALAWKPAHTVDDGLRATLAWFRSLPSP